MCVCTYRNVWNYHWNYPIFSIIPIIPIIRSSSCCESCYPAISLDPPIDPAATAPCRPQDPTRRWRWAPRCWETPKLRWLLCLKRPHIKRKTRVLKDGCLCVWNSYIYNYKFLCILYQSILYLYVYYIYTPTIYDMYVNYLCMVNYGAYLFVRISPKDSHVVDRIDPTFFLGVPSKRTPNPLGWVQNWKPFWYHGFFCHRSHSIYFYLPSCWGV